MSGIRPISQADQILISVNPKAGKSSANAPIDRLTEHLEAAGLRVRVMTDLAEVSELAAQRCAEGRLRALVGVGGDGTAAELLNRTPQGVPLAILPRGTENLLARHLNIDGNPRSLAQTLCDGRTVQLDAGRARSADAGERLFLLMASCGFDAEVVRRMEAVRSGHITHWSYVKPIWQSIRNYQYPQLRVYCRGMADGPRQGEVAQDDAPPGDAALELAVRWAFLFNLPCYGFGLKLSDEASATDGMLDLCLFRRGGFWRGLKYASAVWLRRHTRLADCITRRAASVRVEADGPVPYQLDGDLGGMLPVELDVVPRRLTLVVPRPWAEAHAAGNALAAS